LQERTLSLYQSALETLQVLDAKHREKQVVGSFFSEPPDFVEQPVQFLSFFGSRKSFFVFFNPAFGIDLPDVSRFQFRGF